jgi:hypothetical protein
VLATVADPASVRRLAADLVDPGQADRVASDVRAVRAKEGSCAAWGQMREAEADAGTWPPGLDALATAVFGGVAVGIARLEFVRRSSWLS